MLTCIATMRLFLDERGREFRVWFTAGHKQGYVTGPLGDELIDWRDSWGRFNPMHEEAARLIVNEFLRRAASRAPMEHANAELAIASHGAKGKGPCKCDAHERQLPKRDRVADE